MKTKKSVSLTLAVVLALVCVVGVTIAWLTDKSDEVTNVFTPSDIGVTLEETTENYKMIPGWTIEKDPKATVTAGSEDCYLFIEIEENGVSFVRDNETMPSMYSFDDFLSYEIADGWSELAGVEGVYYKTVTTNGARGTAYSILKDDKVSVKDTVTKEMMSDLIKYEVKPELNFTAYASQYWKDNTTYFTADEAWTNVPR